MNLAQAAHASQSQPTPQTPQPVRSASPAALSIATIAAGVRKRFLKWHESFALDMNNLTLAGEWFAGQVAEIRRTFTPAMKGEKLLAAAVAARKDIASVRAKSVAIGERIKAETAAALVKSTQGKTENELVRFWRFQEIRDEVHELDPVLRIAFVQTAARIGDVDSIQAVAGAPRGFRLVPEETIRQAMNATATAANPEIADLVAFKEAYDAATAAAERGIADLLAAEGVAPATVDAGTMIAI